MKAAITIPSWARFIVSDHTDMERNPHPVDASKVARFSLTLPNDGYFEYAFVDERGEMRADPMNATRADNPWYPDVSAILGPDYRPDRYALLAGKEAGTSRRLRLQSALLGKTRRLILYTPKGAEGPLPCLFLQDGVAYYRIARLPLVLDTLLDEGVVRPAHLVFVEPDDRLKEYSFDPDYRSSFVDEILPFVEDALKAAGLAASGERGLMGASLGGLVSAVLAWERPDLFGAVAAQSGAFLGTPEKPDHYNSKEAWLLEQVIEEASKPIRWSLDCGTLEWLLDVNRELAGALEGKGYELSYHERNAGHNWVNWRNGLAAALRFLLEP